MQKHNATLAPLIGRNTKNKKTTATFLIGLMFIIGGFLYQQDSSAEDLSSFSYAAISFTPDSQKLVFNRCQHQQLGTCHIHILDLKSNVLSYYQPPKDQQWYAAKFSPSGKQIVFVMAPLTPGYLPGEDKNKAYPDWGNAQIAIMDADGRNVRLLTNSKGYKMSPNFSWSGKKVVFVQGEMRKPGSKSLAAGLDAYEIDLESGNVRQLTDFRFFQMGRPSYLPGDERFVVTADTPGRIPGVNEKDIPALWEAQRKFDKEHNNSWVHIFNAGTGWQILEPKFDQLKGARSPLVDAQGNLYFNASNGRTLRRYRFLKDGELHDFLWLPNTGKFKFGGEILQDRFNEVAPDGSHLAVVTGSNNPRDYSGIFWLNFATDQWEEIHVPMEAHLINP
ncbi:MAG: hypothetical protein ACYC1F_09325 [Gallionellaceae bacterium]